MFLKMRTIPMLVVILALSACSGNWSTSNVDLKTTNPSQAPSAAVPLKTAQDIIVTEKDIIDRKYKTLGDIEVTVNKTTIFHPDPTKELVNEKLQEEAVKINADAVVLVRYGTVGVSFMSWGSLDGRGRAIAFEK